MYLMFMSEDGKSLGEWDGWDGGRVDIGAGKYIATLREPF